MSPEQLAQWRADAALMREFSHSPEWACLRRHLELARDQALTRSDVLPPDQVDEVMHWRAVRLGIVDALALPETIVVQAGRIEVQHKSDQSRHQSQRGYDRTQKRNDARAK